MSSLAQQIMKAPHYTDMTFCVFCVINLSMNANNPPPSPYIDITRLQMEYERLQMVKQQSFMNRRIVQKQIQDQLEIEFNGAMLSNSYKVDPEILDQLIHHPLLTTPLSEQLQAMIRTYVTRLQTSDANAPDYMSSLEELIKEIHTSNAITTIGTLEFTDTLAKFGTSRVTCNTLAKAKYTYTTDIVKTVTKEGAKEIYLSLLQLKNRGVLTQAQLDKEYKPFVGKFNPATLKNKK